MCVLTRFPSTLYLLLIFEWIETVDFAKFDTSLCNKNSRSKFLWELSKIGATLGISTENRCHPLSMEGIGSYFSWLKLRGIKVKIHFENYLEFHWPVKLDQLDDKVMIKRAHNSIDCNNLHWYEN